MNQVSEEKKDAVTKTLAIVGFVAAILFAVWLAVQVVSIIPSAFSSLASLADSVYNYEETEMVIANENTVVNAGESTTISWTNFGDMGTYSFVYECTEGAALSIRTGGEIYDLNCDETFELGNVTKVEIVLESEKQRFIDVPYSIIFEPENGEPISNGSKVTVVNASIPTTGLAETEEEEVEETPEPEVAGETTTEPEPTTGGGNYTTGEPTTVERVIYAIPVSDPNGEVDLAVTYLGVGILDDGRFIQTGTIDQDETGAFQFEVKNLGTKTSQTWSYEAKLPSGIDYDSNTQKALKPNEKAVITIGFDGISETGNEDFGARISTKEDTNSSNNAFTWAVRIVD